MMKDPMTDLIVFAIAALLGVGTGIFGALSLIEKSVWPLMWSPQTDLVTDKDARKVHAILNHVIYLFPPTMISTMGAVSVLMIVFVWFEGGAISNIAVAILFFAQLFLILMRLRMDIRGVAEVSPDGDATVVRSGLGALALLHHRGLLMTSSTLIALTLVMAQRA